MSRHYHPPTTTHDEVGSLSDPYYRIIGEIIFQWNCVENALKFAAKRMLGIGIKEARIAMRDPRPQEIFAMIEELALIRHENLGDWSGFEKKLEIGESNRNTLCHARWLDLDGEPGVQNTSGTMKVPFQGSYKRRHYPDPLPITGEWLDNALDNAVDCRELANGLAETIRQIASLRKNPASSG
jgi:hypothetical protein